MDVTKIYEQVNRTVPVGQPEFIARFNQTLNELAAMHDPKYLFPNGNAEQLGELTSGVNVHDEFAPAMVYGVLRFLQPESETHAANFMYFAKQAADTVYRRLSRGKRIRRERW